MPDTAPSPYDDLPPEAFWRTGAAGRDPGAAQGLYTPKFAIDRKMRVATAGSCFAQHVARTLRAHRFKLVDTEPAPNGVPDAAAQRFGYRLYSARYGNIYSARHLTQLLDEAYDGWIHPDPVWTRGDRFFDSQRPGVEPDGLDGAEAVLTHRRAHLDCVRRMFAQTDLFVFTFGLTEAWSHAPTGAVYPTAPGVIAGAYDADLHKLVNFNALQVFRDFQAVRARLKSVNRRMRFLVTVSPVPLTATASGRHVEVASAQSKAALRAACAMLTDRYGDIDYVPSYEVITAQSAGGRFFQDNLRSVSDEGVAAVMEMLLSAHGITSRTADRAARRNRRRAAQNARLKRQAERPDPVCEDELLEAFNK